MAEDMLDHNMSVTMLQRSPTCKCEYTQLEGSLFRIRELANGEQT